MIRKHKRIQSGSGLGGDLIKTGISLRSKALGSDIGQKTNKRIDNIQIRQIKSKKQKNKKSSRVRNS